PCLPPKNPEITIPFEIADQARIFLDQLSRSEKIDQDIRDAISLWLLGYSDILTVYIYETFGWEALGEADRISLGVQEGFARAVNETYKEAERSLFDRLEREMGDDAGS